MKKIGFWRVEKGTGTPRIYRVAVFSGCFFLFVWEFFFGHWHVNPRRCPGCPGMPGNSVQNSPGRDFDHSCDRSQTGPGPQLTQLAQRFSAPSRLSWPRWSNPQLARPRLRAGPAGPSPQLAQAAQVLQKRGKTGESKAKPSTKPRISEQRKRRKAKESKAMRRKAKKNEEKRRKDKRKRRTTKKIQEGKRNLVG